MSFHHQLRADAMSADEMRAEAAGEKFGEWMTWLMRVLRGAFLAVFLWLAASQASGLLAVVGYGAATLWSLRPAMELVALVARLIGAGVMRPDSVN